MRHVEVPTGSLSSFFETGSLVYNDGSQAQVQDPEPLPSRGQAWVQEKTRETPCWARDPVDHPAAVEGLDRVMTRFAQTVLSGVYKLDPPVRGPFGEAEI